MPMPEGEEVPNDKSSQQVNDLLASTDIARAVGDEQFKRFLDYLPFGVAVFRVNEGKRRIAYVNTAFEKLSGHTADELIGASWNVLYSFKAENDSGTLEQALEKSEDFLGVFRRQLPDESFVVQAYASAVENDDGSENYRIVALVDVSTRDGVQFEELEKQIKEKDLLLKELHHRVRNNLQLILSLLRLESRGARRGEDVDLERLAGRVHALALLYSTLSSGEGKPDVDLGMHLSQIASASLEAHGLEGVRLDLRVSHCPVSINVAMPAGLVVNELLTNTFKYAFDGREEGTIFIECVCENDTQYRIVYTDDGVGLPNGVTWPEEGKLSSLIVESLQENTGAQVRTESSPGKGVRTIIEFTHVPPSKRVN